MKKFLLTSISAAALLISSAGFAGDLSGLGLGLTNTKDGKGLDANYALTSDSMVHGQIGLTDQHAKDEKQNAFLKADYDLIAPISKNVSVYAGIGLADTATQGPAARLPLGVMATFDRFPVQVAYEVAPSAMLQAGEDGNRHTFTDHSLSVRYLIK